VAAYGKMLKRDFNLFWVLLVHLLE
jgi:hypothetical protein